MKTIYWYLFFCFSFFSCAEDQEPVSTTEDEVEVVFSAKQSTVSRGEGEEEKLPSIFIFKKIQNQFSLLDDKVETGWKKDTEKGVYLNSLILHSGDYRFLLAGGFTENEIVDDQVLFLSTDTHSGTYNKDYFFGYPYKKRQIEGAKQLKTCRTDLFVDANEKGFESNSKVYSLVSGNKFGVLRKVTRLQGRLDLLVRRGVKIGDMLDPFLEGVGNADAMTNALKRIENIQVKVDGVSSECHIDGLTFSTPANYSFSLKEQTSEFKFEGFNSKAFVDEFNVPGEKDYLPFEHSAYCKGPLLFPAPGDQTEVGVEITIDYKGDVLPTKTVKKSLLLERNKVSLIILWLLNEDVGVNIEIGTENLEYNGEAQGDDGFWN